MEHRRRLGPSAPPEGTHRYEIWQAMIPGEWMSRRQILARCDTTDWPRYRLANVTMQMHMLYGDGVVDELQHPGSGEYTWRRRR